MIRRYGASTGRIRRLRLEYLQQSGRGALVLSHATVRAAAAAGDGGALPMHSLPHGIC